MALLGKRPLIILSGITALVLGLGACSSSADATATPASVPTAQAPQQPAAAPTAMAGATAMPAATALPFTPFDTPREQTGETKYGGTAVLRP